MKPPHNICLFVETEFPCVTKLRLSWTRFVDQTSLERIEICLPLPPDDDIIGVCHYAQFSGYFHSLPVLIDKYSEEWQSNFPT